MDTYFLDRLVNIPYGRGEVFCAVLTNKNNIDVTCIDTIDVANAIVIITSVIVVFNTINTLISKACSRD
jgi:hypothetical protein